MTDHPADHEATDPVALLRPVAGDGGLLFCFGLGFSARALARAWIAAGGRVAGTCRSAGKRDQLAAEGITAHLFDGSEAMDAAGLADLGRAVAILSSVGPDAGGDAGAGPTREPAGGGRRILGGDDSEPNVGAAPQSSPEHHLPN